MIISDGDFSARSDCDNWFNTEHCFMPEVARSCETQGQVIYI